MSSPFPVLLSVYLASMVLAFALYGIGYLIGHLRKNDRSAKLRVIFALAPIFNTLVVIIMINGFINIFFQWKTKYNPEVNREHP